MRSASSATEAPFSSSRLLRHAFSMAAAVAGVLALSGCAGAPVQGGEQLVVPVVQPALTQFGVLGRISVRNGEESFFANLDWQHMPDSDQILISGPLGQGIAEIRRNAQGAVLQMASGERAESADANELAQRVFGFALPVDALPDWLSGRPHGPSARFERDGAGRVSRIQEQGWDIRVLGFSGEPYGHLPRSLSLEWGRVAVRLVVDEWKPAS